MNELLEFLYELDALVHEKGSEFDSGRGKLVLKSFIKQKKAEQYDLLSDRVGGEDCFLNKISNCSMGRFNVEVDTYRKREKDLIQTGQ